MKFRTKHNISLAFKKKLVQFFSYYDGKKIKNDFNITLSNTTWSRTSPT